MSHEGNAPDRHVDNRPEWMKKLPTWREVISYTQYKNRLFTQKEPTQTEVREALENLSALSQHFLNSPIFVQTSRAYSYNDSGEVVCEALANAHRNLGFTIGVDDESVYRIYLLLEKNTTSQDTTLSYNYVQYKYAINVDDIDREFTYAHHELHRMYDEEIDTEKLFSPDQIIASIMRIIRAVNTNQPLSANRILAIIENEELWQGGRSQETGEVWIDDLRQSKLNVVANVGFTVVDHSIKNISEQIIMPLRNVTMEGFFSGITPFDIAPKNWQALTLGPKLGDSTTLPCAVFEAFEVEANDYSLATVEPALVYIPLRPENIFDIDLSNE